MGSEIELKIVGINPNNAKKRLAAINARFKGSYVLQRVTFQGTRSGRIKDYKSNTANDSYYTSWIRVRTDGKRTTLTLKEQRGTGITKRSEYEVEVSDFATMVKILTKMIPDAYRNYMITTRDVYELGDVTITIDKWPYLPYQLEIEGPTEKKIRVVTGEVSFAKISSLSTMLFICQKALDSSLDLINLDPGLYFLPRL